MNSFQQLFALFFVERVLSVDCVLYCSSTLSNYYCVNAAYYIILLKIVSYSQLSGILSGWTDGRTTPTPTSEISNITQQLELHTRCSLKAAQHS
jgi:hypothetical protein